MLPQPNRLPSSDVARVLRHGRRVVAPTIQVTVQKGEADVSRFAFIVSTKIDKRATARNRMKRLLSESIRHMLPRLRGSVDCIVVARKEFSGKQQTEVEGEVLEVLKKAGLLKLRIKKNEARST